MYLYLNVALRILDVAGCGCKLWLSYVIVCVHVLVFVGEWRCGGLRSRQWDFYYL